MDHQPPPFFNRGPAPLAQLSFFVALSLALIFVDSRFKTLELFRQGVSLVTHPMQQVAHLPADFFRNVRNYSVGINQLQAENAQLQQAHLDGAESLLRNHQLEAENERLRKLLDVKTREKARGSVAEILYAARDPFARRVVIDKGQQDKIVPGQPVIDEAGVVGQITRVFAFVSEITLITDKNQTVPVQVARNGLRSVVFGLGNGQLELRFMPANADVQNGDVLVTSGLDGVFLAGFPVAKVVRIERDASYSFARIYCVPIASVESFGQVMVLDPRELRPLPEALSTERSASETRGPKKKRPKAR